MTECKKRILLVVEAMRDGVRQHVEDIIDYIDYGKFEITLVVSKSGADDKFISTYQKIENRIKVIFIDNLHRDINVIADAQAIIELVKIIKNTNPDIIHCHSTKAGVVGRIAAKICGIKQVFYTPNAYSFQNPNYSVGKKKIFVFVEKILARLATTVTINVSEGERQCALENNIDNSEKLKLIYNGIRDISLPNKDELRERNGFGKEDIIVGVTARLSEQKDPISWIDIARNLLQIIPKVKFVYIGMGELEDEVKAYVVSQNLSEQVFFMGFRNDAAQLVSMFDVYLSTALYEGLPYSMIEAMRAGVPIIATNVTGNNELVIENVNGRLFEVHDVKKATELLTEQINNNVIKRNVVKKSYKEKYSVNKMIADLEKLYLL